MAMAATLVRKLFFQSPLFTLTTTTTYSLSLSSSKFSSSSSSSSLALKTVTNFSTSTTTSNKNNNNKKKNNNKSKHNQNPSSSSSSRRGVTEVLVKRRTRSEKEFDEESVLRYGDSWSHIPVMLGEVLEVFASLPLRSFVDCTLGAAGHSSAYYVGLDIDPVAHEKARARINVILHDNSCDSSSNMKAHILLKNFKDIKSALVEIDDKLLQSGVDGILMDLGMSSMQVNNAERGFGVMSNGPLDMRMNPQASLRAEDILNTWPDAEVGRILRDYGEESNWRTLQKKIVKARLTGGLHSTGELVSLIRGSTSNIKDSSAKRAKLSARKKERIKLPSYINEDGSDKMYHISEFLSHPSGVETILNTNALQSFQSLGSNTYRCTLPQIQLMKFEVAPTLDLRVASTDEGCLVEMLSCKFEGSEVVEQQNEHFSASMTNHITWYTIDSESFLDVDVQLNLILEVYTKPFSMLPISTVESPGNLMMQALVDRLVPLLLQQLLQDYDNWVTQQSADTSDKISL